MPLEQVIQLGRTTLEYAILAALPLLAVATVVSVLINILQVLTSIQDQTVSTVPRLLATAVERHVAAALDAAPSGGFHHSAFFPISGPCSNEVNARMRPCPHARIHPRRRRASSDCASRV